MQSQRNFENLAFHASFFCYFRKPANPWTKELTSTQYRFSYPVFTFGSFDTQVNLQCTADLHTDPSIQNTVNSTLVVDDSDLAGKCYNQGRIVRS